MSIYPSDPKQQSFLNTKVGVIQTFIHSTGLIKTLCFLLQYITGKIKPLGK